MPKLLATDGEGERLDRFELITELASGGMATVYLARLSGVAGFQRLVAIKQLHPHLAKEADFVEMFLDEARLAARIHHPNVVPIQEVGQSARGYYLVMDYVEGDTFARLLARSAQAKTPIPWSVTTRVMIDTLAGLHAAHEMKDDLGVPLAIVHRDVSPQNILLGADGVARVLDFGVARAASRLSTTRSGQLKGKLAYMAPEQARGETVDRRADIFSCGVVFWEALALKRLFKGDGEAATLNRVLHEPIAAPSSVRADIPKLLEEVCMRALERDPDRRFPTALAFAEELERVGRSLACVGSVRDVAACLENAFGADLSQQRDAVRAWLARSEPSAASRSRPRMPESSPTRVEGGDGSRSDVAGPRGARPSGPPPSTGTGSPSHPAEPISSMSSAVYSGVAAPLAAPGRRAVARPLAIMTVVGVVLGLAAWGATRLRTPSTEPVSAAPPRAVELAPTGSAADAQPTASAAGSAVVEVAPKPSSARPPAVAPRRAPTPARPTAPPAVPDDLSKNPYR